MLNLADFARIRVLADGLGLETLDRDGPTVVMKFRDRTKVDPMHIIALVKERGDLQLLPPNTLKLDLNGAPTSPRLRRDKQALSPTPAAASAGQASPRAARPQAREP